MKFFTPQLYRRYNSPDDAEADQANEEWEKKLLEYRSYITKHSSGMNDRVRQLAESACLHDSELLSIQEDELEPRPPRFPFFPYSVATVSVSQGGKITNVIYFLWSGIEQSGPDDEWTFSKLRTHWLFDEIEVEKAPLAPLFWHKILWSDGRTVFIPFFDVILQSYSPQDPETAIIAKKHA